MPTPLRTKLALALLVFVCFGGSGRAFAAGFDMGTTTCQDWIDASDDEQDLMIAWLRGYTAGRATSTMYNPANARLDRTLLMGFCRNNANIGLISASSHLSNR